MGTEQAREELDMLNMTVVDMISDVYDGVIRHFPATGTETDFDVLTTKRSDTESDVLTPSAANLRDVGSRKFFLCRQLAASASHCGTTENEGSRHSFHHKFPLLRRVDKRDAHAAAERKQKAKMLPKRIDTRLELHFKLAQLKRELHQGLVRTAEQLRLQEIEEEVAEQHLSCVCPLLLISLTDASENLECQGIRLMKDPVIGEILLNLFSHNSQLCACNIAEVKP
jgi:hypothetical protein